MAWVLNLPQDVQEKMQSAFAHYSKECQVPEETLIQKALEFYLEDLEDALAERDSILAGEETIPLEEIQKKYDLQS